MPLGTASQLNDGSTIQAGHRLEAGTPYHDQRTTGFMVMPGSTLRTRVRSTSRPRPTALPVQAYPRRRLRTNLPLGACRDALDGGSVVLLGGQQHGPRRHPAVGGRRGAAAVADINAPRIVIVAPDAMGSTDEGGLDFLLLNAEQLSRFGAESLLIGGVRRQGANGLEIDVAADTVIVDNHGSVLYGPEILLAASGEVRVEDGVIEVRGGRIGGSSGDLTIAPAHDVVSEAGPIPGIRKSSCTAPLTPARCSAASLRRPGRRVA